MTSYAKFTLAAVQAAPVYFDKDASCEKACKLIEDAAALGADPVALRETWLPGYSSIAWSGIEDPEQYWSAAADYIANGVEIPSPITDQLCGSGHYDLRWHRDPDSADRHHQQDPRQTYD